VTKRKRPENPEALSDEALLAKIIKDNDDRANEQIMRSDGALMPSPAWEMQRIRIFLRHLLTDAGRLTDAEFDYEEWRSDRLDEGDKMLEKYAAAKLTAKWSGQAPPGGTPIR
jgi:hypothetical protein